MNGTTIPTGRDTTYDSSEIRRPAKEDEGGGSGADKVVYFGEFTKDQAETNIMLGTLRLWETPTALLNAVERGETIKIELPQATKDVFAEYGVEMIKYPTFVSVTPDLAHPDAKATVVIEATLNLTGEGETRYTCTQTTNYSYSPITFSMGGDIAPIG